MRLLLVGAGPMATAYAKALVGMGVPFRAVGQGPRSAAVFAEATGARPVEGGLSAFLASAPGGVDAAIVALPIPKLAEAAAQLLKAGVRRILVEKPAGLTADEIDSLARAAGNAGADVFVAYNRRFYASVAAARAMIAEDGGVSSFHFEFTELVARVITPDKEPAVLSNWLLGNSSHVLDLAFHLCGEPVEMHGAVAGSLPWHPAGAVFAGQGRTKAGALFTWHADWSSAGRWGVDIRTPRRRLLLQPLETLQVQEKSSLDLHQVVLADELDRTYKPGIYRQLAAFLSAGPRAFELPSIAAHAAAVRALFLPVLGRQPDTPARQMRR